MPLGNGLLTHTNASLSNAKKKNKKKKTMPLIQWCLETAHPLAESTLISPTTWYCSYEIYCLQSKT